MPAEQLLYRISLKVLYPTNQGFYILLNLELKILLFDILT